MKNAKRPVFGMSSSQGRRQHNCDAVAAHDFNGVLAAAVVDGTGNDADVEHVAHLSVHTAVRVGARKGALPGLLAATELIADPLSAIPTPDGVMVLAVCRPGRPMAIVHVGDCAAFAYDVRDGAGVRALTEDHTEGQWMRRHGEPDDVASRHDGVIYNSIGRATIGTISVTDTVAQTVILASDGVHRVLPAARMAAIVREHHQVPQRCADLLVDGARAASSRDDATALVIARPEPPPLDHGA